MRGRASGIVVCALAVSSCAASRGETTARERNAHPVESSASPSPAPPPRAHRLRAHIAVGPGSTATHGVIAVAYYLPAEVEALQRGESLRGLVSFIERARVRPIELSATDTTHVDFEIQAPPGDVFVSAFVDTRHDLFHSMTGVGEGSFTGTLRAAVDAAGDGDVEMVLSRAPALPSQPEGCAGPRTHLVTIDAPEVAGTVANDTHRRLCVYLPASYATERRRRYPVIYWFPGLMGSDTTFLRHLQTVFDSVVASRRREAIVVGVDTRTVAGSSYLEDTPSAGNWLHFVAETVPGVIDERYRTIRRGTARAVAGHSTGGFNAVSIAMRRPDVFGVVAASSPDALDFRPWMLEAEGHHARPTWLAWTRLEDAVGGPGQLASYAAEWSPDANAPHGFRWPIDLANGEVNDVWARWLAHVPASWLDDPDGLARARRLAEHWFITCGSDDEFGLFEPAQRFHESLVEHGIDHLFVPTPFGHIGHDDERFGPLFRYVLGTLDPAQ